MECNQGGGRGCATLRHETSVASGKPVMIKRPPLGPTEDGGDRRSASRICAPPLVTPLPMQSRAPPCASVNLSALSSSPCFRRLVLRPVPPVLSCSCSSLVCLIGSFVCLFAPPYLSPLACFLGTISVPLWWPRSTFSSQVDGTGARAEFKSKTGAVVPDAPLVVWVDGLSASASEVRAEGKPGSKALGKRHKARGSKREMAPGWARPDLPWPGVETSLVSCLR